MNGDLYFDGKKFISSNRAAKISGYVNDYIGQLCRDGKLVCKMVGRSWYVSSDSLLEHKNASGNGIKSRSQKHINKATLLGSELLQKEELEIERQGVLKHEDDTLYKKQGLEVATSITDVRIPPRKSQNDPLGTLDISEVLKSELPSEVWSKSNAQFDFHVLKKAFIHEGRMQKHKTFLTYMFPRVAAGIISLFIALSGFWFAVQINRDVELTYNNFFQSLQEKQVAVLAQAGETLEANVFSGITPILDRTGITIYRTINGWIFKTQRRILVMTGREPYAETSYELEVDSTKPSQGMVVVPVKEDTNRQTTIAKIKSSFSDEVNVVPDSDGGSGVITPVFKKVKGDDYLYVLVPIKN